MTCCICGESGVTLDHIRLLHPDDWDEPDGTVIDLTWLP